MFNRLPWKKNREIEPTHESAGAHHPWARFFEAGFPFEPGFWFDGVAFPSLDISEGRKKITVKAEIPGMEKDDIEVTVHGRTLTVRGEKSEETAEEDERRYHRERRYGAFHRTVELPAEVDPENVSATYKRGVLEVTLRKTRESAPRKIRIRSA